MGKEDIQSRNVNVGFSGGERKKLELLQLVALSPKYALLDEIDSGVDINTQFIIWEIIEEISKDMGILVISHNAEVRKKLSFAKIFTLKDGSFI